MCRAVCDGWAAAPKISARLYFWIRISIEATLASIPRCLRPKNTPRTLRRSFLPAFSNERGFQCQIHPEVAVAGKHLQLFIKILFQLTGYGYDLPMDASATSAFAAMLGMQRAARRHERPTRCGQAVKAFANSNRDWRRIL